MEDTLQAFAVRAACFIGEQDVPFSEEFDGHDHDATHLIAYLGDEPIGTVRLRWFKSFAMPDHLAVIQRFRSHGVGSLLLEQARAIAESRGSRLLYVRTTPLWAGYFERLGWRRLDETPGQRHGALVCPTDSAQADRPRRGRRRSVGAIRGRYDRYIAGRLAALGFGRNPMKNKTLASAVVDLAA